MPNALRVGQKDYLLIFWFVYGQLPMHIILGIIVFLIFLGCAPKLFKWLLLIDVVALVLYYIGLRICALIIGASKGGARSGALADYAMYGIQMMLAAPAIVVLGILSGLIVALTKPKTKT